MLRMILCSLLAIALALPGLATAIELELTVHNRLEQARNQAALTVGVPFPPGELADPAQLQASDATGGSILPLQARALSTWADGSARWVLLDMPVDVAALGQTQIQLNDFGSGPVASALEVQESADAFVLKTGLIQVRISRTSGRILDAVDLDSDGDGTYEASMILADASEGLVVEDPSGNRYLSNTNAPWISEIEESGPQRITIRLQGGLSASAGGSSHLEYDARISAMANSADLRIQLTLRNPRQGSVHFDGDGSVQIEDASLFFQSAFDSPSMRFGGDAGASGIEVAGGTQHAWLHQDSNGDPDSWNRWDERKQTSYAGFRVFADDVQHASGARSEGWMEVGSGGLAVGLGIREFWQNFPNALDAWSDGRIAARFFSRYQNGFEWLRGGEQKTHFISLNFSTDPGAGTQAAMNSALNPLMALATPEWYAASKSFRRFLPSSVAATIPEFDNLELAQRATLYGGVGYRDTKSLQVNIADDDVYGWLDYGDAYADYEHEGDRANGENDLSYGMALQMVRSGNPDWWDLIDPMARHLADIDVYHTLLEDEGWKWREGGFFEHDRTGSRRHRGNYPQPNHYNAQGMFTHFYLTGDPVVREAALKVATNAKWRTDRRSGGYSYVDSDELRSPAWMMNCVMEGWKLTRDQGFLDTLYDMIDRTHPDTRCWPWGPGCSPSEIKGIYKSYINMWELGMLMGSQGDLLDEFEANGMAKPPRAIEALQHYGNFIQDNAWHEGDQIFVKIWRFADGTIQPDNGPGNILRVIDGLVHAYNHTGDSSLLVNCDRAFATATADPWYPGSGVTYADVKMQAVQARNGFAWEELVGGGVEIPLGCLKVSGTSPGPSGEWELGSPLSITFSRAPLASSLEGKFSISASTSGTLNVDVNLSGRTVALTLDPLPAEGETISISLADGVADAEGVLLDGDRDGNCGGAWSWTFDVASAAPGDDVVAPEAIDDLGLSFDQESGEARFTWTAPADEGLSGRASSYEIRYDANTVSAPFSWSAATVWPSASLPAPAEPGVGQEAVLLIPEVSDGVLRVQIRSRDAAGNLSAPSNMVRDEAAPQLSLAGAPNPVVAPEGFLSTPVIASELLSGQSPIASARYRFVGEDIDRSRACVIQTGSPVYHALLDGIHIRAEGRVDGDRIGVIVEAADDGGNWSAPFEFEVLVSDEVPFDDGCPGVAGVNPPASSTPVVGFDRLQILFSSALDAESVLGALEFVDADQQPIPYATEWIAVSRVLELQFDAPLSGGGVVTLTVRQDELRLFGEEEIPNRTVCSRGRYSSQWQLPEGAPVPAGSDLASTDQDGIVGVDGFQLQLEDIEPGATFYVFDQSGQPLFQQEITSVPATVDLSSLDVAPGRKLILSYRKAVRALVLIPGQSYTTTLQR